MYIVILGAGHVGFMLARQLIAEGKSVAIIENDPSRSKEAVNSLDCLVVNDSGTNLAALKKAGIQKASAFVSVTGSDELNLISCGIVSNQFPEVSTIARVRNLGYSETSLISSSILGIDHIINPDLEAAKAIVLALKHGARSDIMLFENTKIQMRDLFLSRESSFIDKPLRVIREECRIEFLISVVIREDYYIIPEGDTVLKENDRIYILAEEDSFDTIFEKEKVLNQRIEKILIVGGGTVGAHLLDYIFNEETLIPGFLGALKRFLKRGKRNIHVIDKDYDRCKFLAERFPKALVKCQDIMDEGVLDDSETAGSDLIITTTGNHELNIITGSYAKTIGIPKAIALVIRNNYKHLAHNLNLDVTISRNSTVVNSIIKVLRKGNIKNVYDISEGKLEVIEFSLSEKSAVIGKRLKDIKLPEKTLVLFITREQDTIIPYGALKVEVNDHIALITERESIKKLENMIAG